MVFTNSSIDFSTWCKHNQGFEAPSRFLWPLLGENKPINGESEYNVAGLDQSLDITTSVAYILLWRKSS